MVFPEMSWFSTKSGPTVPKTHPIVCSSWPKNISGEQDASHQGHQRGINQSSGPPAGRRPVRVLGWSCTAEVFQRELDQVGLGATIFAGESQIEDVVSKRIGVSKRKKLLLLEE